MRLSAHLGVVHRAVRRGRRGARRGGERGERDLAAERPADLRQMPDGVDGKPVDQRGFAGVGRGEHQPPQPGAARGERDAQHPWDGAHGPIQRELANDDVPAQRVRGDLPGGGQDPQRDGQIEDRARLPRVGRGQVHGDPPHGHLEAGVPHRRAHPLPGFPHCGVRKPNDREGGEPGADVQFHPHHGRLQSHHRRALDLCQHSAVTRGYYRWKDV